MRIVCNYSDCVTDNDNLTSLSLLGDTTPLFLRLHNLYCVGDIDLVIIFCNKKFTCNNGLALCLNHSTVQRPKCINTYYCKS